MNVKLYIMGGNDLWRGMFKGYEVTKYVPF